MFKYACRGSPKHLAPQPVTRHAHSSFSSTGLSCLLCLQWNFLSVKTRVTCEEPVSSSLNQQHTQSIAPVVLHLQKTPLLATNMFFCQSCTVGPISHDIQMIFTSQIFCEMVSNGDCPNATNGPRSVCDWHLKAVHYLLLFGINWWVLRAAGFDSTSCRGIVVAATAPPPTRSPQ